MIATDEQRRAAARGLRGIASAGWSSGECFYSIVHALGIDPGDIAGRPGALYGLLANLIDPDGGYSDER